jgi:1-acyl-sn-glycerol-3-phosphate acyltransferase
MHSMIRTALIVVFAALCIVLVLPFLILWTLVTGSPVFMNRGAMNAVRVIDWIGGIRARVTGLENIPNGPCLFVCNHVSNVDPLALVPLIPRRVNVFLKKELFRIPILSYGMRLNGYICVDRANRKSAVASVESAIRHLREGVSVVIFPEGTRSPDGRLRPFKKGACVTAIEARVPVVPVSIAGTKDLMPKGQWAIHPGEVRIHFGPAVDTTRYGAERRNEMLALIEARVAEGLPPEQQPLPRSQSAKPAS